MKKVYLAGSSVGYLNWIFKIGYELTKNLKEANLVFFTGGEDVSPSLYGEKANPTIYSNEYRDKLEVEIYKQALNWGIPMIGVCRGGQLITVMNGGKLVQDMEHPSFHDIETIDGRTMKVTSSHHNQFLVEEKLTGLKEGVDYDLLGWTKKLSKYHYGTKEDYKFPDNYREPEIILWHKTKQLSIQPHPEWMEMESPFVKYCQEIIKLINP